VNHGLRSDQIIVQDMVLMNGLRGSGRWKKLAIGCSVAVTVFYYVIVFM